MLYVAIPFGEPEYQGTVRTAMPLAEVDKAIEVTGVPQFAELIDSAKPGKTVSMEFQIETIGLYKIKS